MKSLPKVVFFAMLVGVTIRLMGLVFILWNHGIENLIYGDALGYIALSNELAAGHGFVTLYPDEGYVAELFRTPGLPVLLLLTTTLGGLKLHLFLQSLFGGALLPLLLWRIGNNLFGRRAGLIAAWLGSLELLLVVFSWFPLTEIPFLIFGLGALDLAITGLRAQSRPRILLSGALAGFAALIRPGNVAFFLMGYGLCAIGLFWKKDRRRALLAAAGCGAVLIVILPWVLRNGQVSGTYALTGAGWRNVYTDYTASIRSIDRRTTFWDEKKALKRELMSELNVQLSALNSPALNAEFRRRAFLEITAHPLTVIKLQSMLGISYFTNDSYHSYLMRLGMIPKRIGRVSSTFAVLTEGVGAFGKIWNELRKDFFLPILGRLVQFVLLGSAIVGFFRTRHPFKWVMLAVILFGFVSSSAIGLGVEGRLRLSVIPFILLLAGAGWEPKGTKTPSEPMNV